jgi:hypothetical protein
LNIALISLEKLLYLCVSKIENETRLQHIDGQSLQATLPQAEDMAVPG